jgi:hypothetical protein
MNSFFDFSICQHTLHGNVFSEHGVVTQVNVNFCTIWTIFKPIPNSYFASIINTSLYIYFAINLFKNNQSKWKLSSSLRLALRFSIYAFVWSVNIGRSQFQIVSRSNYFQMLCQSLESNVLFRIRKQRKQSQVSWQTIVCSFIDLFRHFDIV